MEERRHDDYGYRIPVSERSLSEKKGAQKTPPHHKKHPRLSTAAQNFPKFEQQYTSPIDIF